MSDALRKLKITWSKKLSNPYGNAPEVKDQIEAKIVEACGTKAYDDHQGKTLLELGAESVEITSTLHKGGRDRKAPKHICVHVCDAEGKPILTYSPLTGKSGKTHHMELDVSTPADEADRTATAISDQPEADDADAEDA